MKAIGIKRFNGSAVLEWLELPIPSPGPSEVLIRIHAAGINPVDWKIREGLFEGRMPHQFPIVLGWDASGVVEKAGNEIRALKVGDPVMAYGRKDLIHEGTYAEYIVLTEKHCALKPKNLSFEQAAVVPLSALTAHQSLFDSLKIQKGETILIHAGGGGVGGYAIPMAKQAGARVITTASAGKHEYVKALGADKVIDYQKADFVEEVKKHFPDGIDAVFDTVGGTAQLKSSQVLKPKGRITSILAIQKNFFTDKDLIADYVFVRPDAGQLEKIRAWIEGGSIQVSVDEICEFSPEGVAKAHEKLEGGHQRGKLAVKIR